MCLALVLGALISVVQAFASLSTIVLISVVQAFEVVTILCAGVDVLRSDSAN